MALVHELSHLLCFLLRILDVFLAHSFEVIHSLCLRVHMLGSLGDHELRILVHHCVIVLDVLNQLCDIGETSFLGEQVLGVPTALQVLLGMGDHGFVGCLKS